MALRCQTLWECLCWHIMMLRWGKPRVQMKRYQRPPFILCEFGPGCLQPQEIQLDNDPEHSAKNTQECRRRQH